MADDDPDEAGNPKECHEPERSSHDRQSDQRSDRSVRCGRKHKQGLDGILELHEQRQVDADKRDEKNDGEIHESIDLLRFLTSDLQLISRRKLILKIFQFGFDRSKDFRSEHSGRRKAQYRNRAKMFAAPYATRFKNVPHGGNRKQRNSSVPLIAAADELATSAFVMLTRFARSGSISIFTCGLSGAQSSLSTATPFDCRTTSIVCEAMLRSVCMSWISVRGSVSA